MTELQWSDRYSVGISSIDDQHRHLFVLLEQLDALLANEAASDKQTAMLHEVVDELRRHFAAEETMLLKYRYPGYRKQKTDHEQFLSQVEDLESNVLTEKKSLSRKDIRALGHALGLHILGADSAYAEFLRDQGVR